MWDSPLGARPPSKRPAASWQSTISATRRATVVEDTPHGTLAVGLNAGKPFAVSNRCRHLFASLGDGRVTDDGCLQCPKHAALYNVDTGEMVKGPQGAYKPLAGAVKATVGARSLKNISGSNCATAQSGWSSERRAFVEHRYSRGSFNPPPRHRQPHPRPGGAGSRVAWPTLAVLVGALACSPASTAAALTDLWPWPISTLLNTVASTCCSPSRTTPRTTRPRAPARLNTWIGRNRDAVLRAAGRLPDLAVRPHAAPPLHQPRRRRATPTTTRWRDRPGSDSSALATIDLYYMRLLSAATRQPAAARAGRSWGCS